MTLLNNRAEMRTVNDREELYDVAVLGGGKTVAGISRGFSAG